MKMIKLKINLMKITLKIKITITMFKMIEKKLRTTKNQNHLAQVQKNKILHQYYKQAKKM